MYYKSKYNTSCDCSTSRIKKGKTRAKSTRHRANIVQKDRMKGLVDAVLLLLVLILYTSVAKQAWTENKANRGIGGWRSGDGYVVTDSWASGWVFLGVL